MAIAMRKTQLMTAMAGAIESANGLDPQDIDTPLNQEQSPTTNCKILQLQDSDAHSNNEIQRAVNDCPVGRTSMAGSIFSGNGESPRNVDTPLNQEQSPATNCKIVQLQGSSDGRSDSNTQRAVNDCSIGDTAMGGSIDSANGLNPVNIDTPLNEEQSPTTNCKILQLQDSDGAAIAIP